MRLSVFRRQRRKQHRGCGRYCETIFGVLLLWGEWHGHVPAGEPLLRGWVGMLGV